MKWKTKEKSNIKTFFTFWPTEIEGTTYWLEYVTVKETPSYYGAVGWEIIEEPKPYRGGVFHGPRTNGKEPKVPIGEISGVAEREK